MRLQLTPPPENALFHKNRMRRLGYSQIRASSSQYELCAALDSAPLYLSEARQFSFTLWSPKAIPVKNGPEPWLSLAIPVFDPPQASIYFPEASRAIFSL